MKRIWIIMAAGALAAGWLCGASQGATEAVRPFADYDVILQKAPFGSTAADEEAPAPRVVQLQESFAAQMSLVEIKEVKGSDYLIEVSVFDRKDNNYFTLRIGETDPSGVKLVEADYEMDEAMLQKGDEVVVLSMRAGTTGQVLSEADRETRRGEMEQKRLSYIERRRLRQEARKKALEEQAKQPILTGKELEDKLQESAMESIRKGMPPLPVTLTPENDAQLVAEGFLPPMDEEGYEVMDNGYYGPDGMYYEYEDAYEDEYEEGY